MARESIANIISRVEADFGPGALDPLVNLIEQFNSDPTIETTHTIASHRINAPAFLHTAIIVGPRGNLWLEPSELESNSQECVRALSAFAARQLTLDTTIRIGPIEFVWDPGGAVKVAYGMEFRVHAVGPNRDSVLASWRAGVASLISFLAQGQQR